MPGISLAQATADLDEARTALSAARQAQATQMSTSTGGRRIDRALLESLVKDVATCEQRVARLSRPGGRMTSASVVPL